MSVEFRFDARTSRAPNQAFVDWCRTVRRLDAASPMVYGRGDAGQLVVPARIGRVGVLEYGVGARDGSARREYRSAKEAFDSASLRSLEGVPVVSLRDHVDLVDSSDWRRKALGFVMNARRDGEFIVADLVIGDEETARAVESKELVEISAGYLCALVESTRGDADFEQGNIRYNHVALLPPGRGRAGSDVRVLIEAIKGKEGRADMRIQAKKRRVDADESVSGQDFVDALKEGVGRLSVEELQAIADIVKQALDGRENDPQGDDEERRSDGLSSVEAARRRRDAAMRNAWMSPRR